MHPTILMSCDKTGKKEALQFAREQSRVFSNTRIILEDFPDAGGITVWKNSNMAQDNRTTILFINGVRKKRIQ